MIPNIMFFSVKNTKTVFGFELSQISAWGHFGRDILYWAFLAGPFFLLLLLLLLLFFIGNDLDFRARAQGSLA